MMGSNALLPIFQQLGTWVNAENITLVYTKLSSCGGVTGVINNIDARTQGATTSSYWDSSGNTQTCTIDDNSKYPDVGISAVFPSTCIPNNTGFSGIGDFQGPVVSAVWFVPSQSHQTSISAEAAYLLYSGAGKVAPWTDPKNVFLRGSTGGTQVMMGFAIGVPPTQWIGKTTNSSDLERSSVIAAGADPNVNPDSVLGLGELDYAEDATGSANLKMLAYRHYGQSCAYYPNSTLDSRDLANVRDGHYVGWGPTHLVAKVNAQHVPINANAGTLINYFIGNQAVPRQDLLSLVIQRHLIPQCAMRVSRSQEVGPVVPFKPAPSCGCFFDLKATGSTSCAACKTSADCPATAPDCNLGYCEAQ
jgi:hypothetical protein